MEFLGRPGERTGGARPERDRRVHTRVMSGVGSGHKPGQRARDAGTRATDRRAWQTRKHSF